MSDNDWTFIDWGPAFPRVGLHDNLVASIGLSTPGHDVAINFVELGGRVVPFLQVFSESWSALAESGLMDVLAGLSAGVPTIDDVKQRLVEAGCVDETAKHVDRSEDEQRGLLERRLRDIDTRARLEIDALRGQFPDLSIAGGVSWDIQESIEAFEQRLAEEAQS